MTRRSGLGMLSISALPSMFEMLDLDLEEKDASLPISEAGGIDHFLFVPAGGVREVQLRLYAWGRPKMLPSTSDEYGYAGPLVPGDFGDMNNAKTDLDGVDSHRTGLAIGSFQRWWNTANAAAGNPLRTDAMYDLATHNALVSVSGGNIIPTAPTAPATPTGVVVQGPWTKDPTAAPLPSWEPTLPGSADPVPGTLPPSLPGNIFPSSGSGAATNKQNSWISYALIAAGLALGLYVIVAVSRKRRKAA